jgi:hypothetical protein
LILSYERDYPERYAEVCQMVVDGIKAEHASAPKYQFIRESDAEIIADLGVSVRNVEAAYVANPGGRARVLPLDADVTATSTSVEEFIARYLRADGREVLFCESRPFQALYGSLMWDWVQSPADPELRVSGFGGREGVDEGENGLVWTLLPDDFGRAFHARRRQEDLDAHLDGLPDNDEDLVALYELNQEASAPLRQYLWAYGRTDYQKARRLIQVLGTARVKMVLRFLAECYWERYVGWPDLLS